MVGARGRHSVGIDFGKVIMGATIDGEEDTSFLGRTFDEAMKSPPNAGAFEGVQRLVTAFEGRAWIVSKCGESVQRKTEGWLDAWSFYEKTGLKRSNVRFCRRRSDKAGICRELGINYFIDDRIDVLRPMVGQVPHLFLFGEQEGEIPDWAVHTLDWSAALGEILPLS